MNFLLLCSIAATSVLSSACMTRAQFAAGEPIGHPASPALADRTVVLAPDTYWVRVRSGEIVSFVADGKTFAWDFSGIGMSPSFDLQKVAPPDALDHEVLAYMADARSINSSERADRFGGSEHAGRGR